MESATTSATQTPQTRHRFFATIYERMGRMRGARNFFEPLREEAVGQARGVVLEIGAGNGLNFAFYDPSRVERVAAIEPDAYMRRYAEARIAGARVPITLAPVGVEVLPFADATFDTALATLVFCSVNDPAQGLAEVRRVLKPSGVLVLVEHVRSAGALAARMQDVMTPFTICFAGNCHSNRDTARTVQEAGFQIESLRHSGGGIHPIIVLRAIRAD